MADQKQLENSWDAVPQPVLALVRESGGCRVIYQNPAAQALCPQGETLLAQLVEPARQQLLERLGQEPRQPVLCHVGQAVYFAAHFPGTGCDICLFQEITGGYRENQRILDDALVASQAKTSFLAEMSHDIRTPMGAIIGLTEIALSQKEVPPRIGECLGKIKVASGHMMSLLNEVLDMSRIESGRILIQPEPVNVADLLHELLIVARPQADAGRLQFHLEMGEVARERILADSVRLKQICLNLLSNAIKYTPAGGQVTLYLAVDQTGEPDQVRMTVRVTDTGIGMSREFLTRLFVPFEREQKSTVNKIQGTGLGMAITKNLIELMHGEIQVESEMDKGSCFTVEIPFQALEEEQLPQELTGRRVLLLDGDGKRGAAICRMLESLRMQADWAKSADEAVNQLNEAEFSDWAYFAFLAVEGQTDVEMMLFLPEVRRRMGPDFPILMLAESDWSQTEYMLTRAGVDAFIPLPLFRSRLAAGLYGCTQEGQPGPDTGERTRDFSHKRLLLAEDNELNREIAMELLGESGVCIETAEDGKQAVERFQASAPGYYDMILMDIQMPRMNGLDATRAIRALDRPDADQIPIVAMTANAFVEDVQNSMEAGMNAHLSKPLDMDRVFATMEQFLGGPRK